MSKTDWLDEHLAGTRLGQLIAIVLLTVLFPLTLVLALCAVVRRKPHGTYFEADPEALIIGAGGFFAVVGVVLFIIIAMHVRWS